MGGDAAHQAGKHRGQHEDGDLVADHVHTHHAGGDLRAVQRTQGAAEGGVDEVEGCPHAHRQQDRHHPVPVLVTVEFEAEQAEGRYRHAVGAAGPLGLVAQGDVEDDAQAEGGHGQVIPLQLEDRPGHQRGQQAGGCSAGPHGQQRMPAEVGGQHRRSVGSDAQETGVAQADLAGKADQQVEAEDDDRVDGHADRQVHVEAVGQHQRQQRKNRDDDVQPEVGAFLHVYTRSVTRAPNRPRGMKKRMKRISTKGIASL